MISSYYTQVSQYGQRCLAIRIQLTPEIYENVLNIVCSSLYTDDYNYGLQMFIMQFKHLIHCVPRTQYVTMEINSVYSNLMNSRCVPRQLCCINEPINTKKTDDAH